MPQFIRHHLTTVIVAMVTAAVTAGTPAIARTVADYARNADKVDGKHAVNAGASRPERARALVATNGEGRLPNNIIAKAPDAAKLAGRRPSAYRGPAAFGLIAGNGAPVVSSSSSNVAGVTRPFDGHFCVSFTRPIPPERLAAAVVSTHYGPTSATTMIARPGYQCAADQLTIIQLKDGAYVNGEFTFIVP